MDRTKRREIKWGQILSRNNRHINKTISDFYYGKASLKQLREALSKVPNQEFSYCYELHKRGVKRTKECIRKAFSRYSFCFTITFVLLLLFASMCSAQQRFSYQNQPWPPRNPIGQYLSPKMTYYYYGYGPQPKFTGAQPFFLDRPGVGEYRPFWTPQFGLQYRRVR